MSSRPATSSLLATKSTALKSNNHYIPQLSHLNLQSFDGLYTTFTRQHEASLNKNPSKKDTIAENDANTDPSPHLFMHTYDSEQKVYFKENGAELDMKKAMDWSKKKKLAMEAANDIKRYKGSRALERDISAVTNSNTQLLVNNYYKYKSREELTKLKQDEHRELVVMMGENMGTFFRGEGLDVFNNKYLLLEKLMLEQHEDLEGLKETNLNFFITPKRKKPQ
jgi:hypothetical protein